MVRTYLWSTFDIHEAERKLAFSWIGLQAELRGHCQRLRPYVWSFIFAVFRGHSPCSKSWPDILSRVACVVMVSAGMEESGVAESVQVQIPDKRVE